MGDLTILTVTKGDASAMPFLRGMADLAQILGAGFVIGLDGRDAFDWACAFPGPSEGPFDMSVHRVESKGYIESVLDDVLQYVPEGWVLRLDDDEQVSGGLFQWLEMSCYRASDHWKFPRAHLWGSPEYFLCTPPLWPDWQTRLSIKAKSGGRRTVHAGSPFGGGTECPFPIEHHKFLVKDRSERERIAGVYDRFAAGYGTGAGMLPFSLPELVFDDPGAHLREVSEATA